MTPDEKRLENLTARAALLGIEAVPLKHSRAAPGSYLLIAHTTGTPAGVVTGLDALAAVIGGFEQAVGDMRELVRSKGDAA